ncbi:hypothetical protein G9A89_017519 [Geosiphon pyriformis]|nr:hypothetical protein G9A89_017519 [Geosiphon pyriformis]
MEIENQQFQNQSINQQNSPDSPEYLGIIPKRAHLTDAEFNLCYPEDQSTTLPPRSITKIDLKIVVEILPGIMVQIAFIQEEVVDSKYTENLMVLLQNNSEKSYTINSKEKIAQVIFLSLVKIGKFVPVENCEELLQTIRGTFGFGLIGKRIKANFAETIEEKGKIKIPIANTTKELIYILEDTIIGYLGMELENASTPQEILNFLKITLINWQQLLECYQFMTEELTKLNIGTMDPD